MLRIGNIRPENNLILAPMLGVNCNAFRLLCKDYGAGLVATPMIHPDSLFNMDDRIDVIRRERPAVAQIVGKDTLKMSEAAKILEEKYDIIDINMGCPDKEILAQQCGAFFSKHPEQAYHMIGRVIDSVNCPVTAKIRIGWDEKSINAVEVAKKLEDLGIGAVIVHARTRKQVYSGKASWDVIKEVKESVDIPVIGNGDVFTYNDYNDMVKMTGVDFVMIGRGAIGNPQLFRECIEQREIKKDIVFAKKLFDEFLFYYQKYSPREAFSEIRQHAMWFTKGIKRSTILKNTLIKAENVEEIINILNSFELS